MKKPQILVIALFSLAVLTFAARLALKNPGADTAAEGKPAVSGQQMNGQNPVAVEVSAVTKETFVQEANAVGTMKSNESVVLKPEISGRVAALHFQDGARVAAGALLVSLDASVEAAELQQAEASLALARANLKRNEDLFQKKFVSAAMLDNSRSILKVEAAKVALAAARFAKTRLRAPFAGVVGLRNVSVGDYVKEGEALINLEDTATLKVDFRLPEVWLDRLRPGLALEVRVDALPGEARAATLSALDPLVDVEGRAVSCRATLPNLDGRLSPGMFARVRIRFGERETVTIPEEAVVSGVLPQVFRLEGDRARAVAVKLGQRQGARVEVLEGLAPGDLVVTAGQLKLSDGTGVTR
ncbi:MAG: efflux RND transporter periplasmic adaptor subunit [Zoogloeaceae bacterium]|jgi:membrane fusion protein (multidrug efflux system)|nr:efflux RND transporter periplasmic adaptor subunit [Zoogloeaceae bacterium]